MEDEAAADDHSMFMSDMLKDKAVRCLRRAQKFKASGRLELAVAQLERCHWCLESALGECYENLGVRFLLVGCLLAQRQFAQAKDEALLIYRSLSEDGRRRMHDPVLHITIAHTSQRLGQPEDALAFLQEATVFFAEHPLPWLALAEVHLQAGEHLFGAEAAREALARDKGPWATDPRILPRPMQLGERVRTLRCLGVCLLEQSLFKEARQQFKSALLLIEAGGESQSEASAAVRSLMEDLSTREHPKKGRASDPTHTVESPLASDQTQIILQDGSKGAGPRQAGHQGDADIAGTVISDVLPWRPGVAQETEQRLAAAADHLAVASSPAPSPRSTPPSTPPQSPKAVAAFAEYVSPARPADSPPVQASPASREVSVNSLATLGARPGSHDGVAASRRLPFGTSGGGASLPPPASASMSVAECQGSQVDNQPHRGHSAIATKVTVTTGAVIGDFDLIAGLMPDDGDNPHTWLQEKPGFSSDSWITCCASSCHASRLYH